MVKSQTRMQRREVVVDRQVRPESYALSDPTGRRTFQAGEMRQAKAQRES